MNRWAYGVVSFHAVIIICFVFLSISLFRISRVLHPYRFYCTAGLIRDKINLKVTKPFISRRLEQVIPTAHSRWQSAHNSIGFSVWVSSPYSYYYDYIIIQHKYEINLNILKICQASSSVCIRNI